MTAFEPDDLIEALTDAEPSARDRRDDVLDEEWEKTSLLVFGPIFSARKRR